MCCGCEYSYYCVKIHTYKFSPPFDRLAESISNIAQLQDAFSIEGVIQFCFVSSCYLIPLLI